MPQEYTLGDYRSPNADILFALKYGAEVERLDNWDGEIAAEILEHAAKFVEGEIAPAEPELDKHEFKLENGRVTVPPVLCKIVEDFVEGGWFGLHLPKEHGGQELPAVLSNVLFEMIAGASLNVSMALTAATAALKLLLSQGSEDQKARYIPGILSGEYNATIVLSEPQAGSDLRLVRTTGTANDDGSWSLQGSKIFISGADHNMNPNVLHCIVARTEGAPEGTRGLSLFLCPNVLEDGTRNNVSISGVEEKMGLHTSPTCQVNFDGAWAEMVGEPGEGLGRMFTMMNAMRLDVAVQGVGACQIALQRSAAYAESRIQGRSISTETTSSEAIPISQHGDVKRMLLTQEALVQGARAMTLRTAVELALNEHSKLAAFMLHICKVFASDAACRSADMAIQIHGGYGYVKDYQVEQIFRDARVARIYEGANGLHATNLTTSLRKPGGQENAQAFEQDIMDAITSGEPATTTALTDALEDWRKAKDHVAEMVDPGMVAYDYLNLSALVAFGAAWSRLEGAADKSDDPEHLREVAAFVRERMLPETAYLAQQITRPR